MPWSHTEHRQKPSLTHFLAHKTAKVAQRKDMYTGRSVFVLHGTLSTWLDAFWLFWQCSLPHSSEISSPSAHFASDKDEIVEVVFGLHSVRTTQPGMEPRAQESSLCYCASETGCWTLLRYSQELLHSSLCLCQQAFGATNKKQCLSPMHPSAHVADHDECVCQGERAPNWPQLVPLT